MSLLNNNMPEVGTPEYMAMLEGIPAQWDARTAANKARFAPMVKAAGLNPDTYDYASISPEMYDQIGSQDPRALKLSTISQDAKYFPQFDAYTGAAGRAISGGLSDAEMWADYEKNKSRTSDFQNFMQSGIKAGLGAMVGAGIGDAAGLWNLGGDTAALGMNQVGAMNPMSAGGGGYLSAGEAAALTDSIGATAAAPVGGGSITGGMWATSPMSAVGAGDLTLVSSGGLEGLGSMAAGSGGLMSTLKGYAKPVIDGVKGINDLTGGNLGGIVGGLLGAAAGKDTTTSASKDPWGPAQPYLKENLARNQRMQDYYMANPFSQEQKTAYQGLLNTNANGMANAAPMAGMANNFMSSRGGKMGAMPQFVSGVTAPQVDWTKYANIGKGG